MTLEELGAALRAEREKRGLRIEDVANHLKIGARLLRALEEGDASSLPHLAYAKGFIRSYSSYLGMGAEEVNEAVAVLGGVNPTVPQPVYTPEPSMASGSSLKWLGLLIVLALLGGGLYMAWQQGALEFLSRQTRRMAQPSPPLQAPDVAEAVQEKEKEKRPASLPRTGTAQKEPAPAASAPPPPAPVAPAGAGEAASPALPQVEAGIGNAQATAPTWGVGAAASAPVRIGYGQSAMPPAAQAEEAALPHGQHKITITATEECWVHSNADKSDTRQFSLRKGETFALTFSKSLELKLGNAGGVRIRYNGQDMPAPGQSGQVRTLTFPPAAEQ